ncbi:MAG: sigma-70 family RNA polymerase sigma factor [Vicinamibacterales bacterium]
MPDSSPPPAPRAGTPGSLDEAYAVCTPLLLGALGRLGRMGYRVDPAEGLDLVHDFFVEALPGLLERFDAARDTRFTTYAYGAFVRFARPRIVRLRRWRRMTAALDSIPELAAAPAEHDEPFSEALTHSMAAAFAALPPDARRALRMRIVDEASERELARTLKLSRYAVRQRTAEALGRLAVAIGREDRIPAPVRPLALRLWRDGRPLMAVARELGLSRQHAHAAHRALLASIGAALLGDDQRTKEKPHMATTLCETWQRVMARPDDVAALDAVKDRLVELIDHVDDCDACRTTAGKVDEETATRVYERIADLSSTMAPDDLQDLEAWDRARADEDAQIVEAMESAVLPALPKHLLRPASVPADVTPLELFRASNAVNLMTHGHAVRAQGQPVRLSKEGVTIGDRVAIRPENLVKEIARHAEVTPDVAAALFDWVLDAAATFPQLFIHFDAQAEGSGVLRMELLPPADDVNLLERWAPVEARGSAATVQEALDELASAMPALAEAASSPVVPAEDRRRAADLIELAGRQLKLVLPRPPSPHVAPPGAAPALASIRLAAAAAADAFHTIREAAPAAAPAAEIAESGAARAEELVRALDALEKGDG